MLSPAGPPIFMYCERGRLSQGAEKVVNGQVGDSFLRMMDREAAARMSGRHQMNPIS